MAKEASKADKNKKTSASQAMTKKELKTYLADLSDKMKNEELPHLHTLVALDHLFRLPNARKLFDEELTSQAKQLWNELKSTGIDLTDPPVLFGTDNLPMEEGALDGMDA